MNDKWITFDCFGTLVDWRGGFDSILRPLAGARTEALLEAYHELEPLLESERPHRLYKDVLSEGVRRASAKIGLPLTAEQCATLPGRWGAQRVFPDVEPALAALRGKGWKLAVLTNCDIDLFAQTERAFQRPFDLVITAETVKDYKPSLAHFRHFWRVSGVEKRDWIHVACSFFHDIGAAREMEVPSIWVDREKTGQNPANASARIESAATLAETVERLHASA